MADALVEKVNKWTVKENNQKMSQEAKEHLKAYYDGSVRRLEEYLGIDLSQVWF